MSFNPEDKIRWEELAPSLQAMFKELGNTEHSDHLVSVINVKGNPTKITQTKGNGETSTVLNIDTALNSSSTNPVQNKVIKKMYDDLVTLINNTKKALEDTINSTKKALETSITKITNRLDGNEFVKNRTTNYKLNLRYEKKSGDNEPKLHIYNDNTEIPLAGTGSLSSGYYKTSENFIIQWGTITTTSYYQTVSFNSPFPNTCFFVTTSPIGTTVDRSALFYTDTITKSSFKVYGQDANRDEDKRTGTLMWFAFGI